MYHPLTTPAQRDELWAMNDFVTEKEAGMIASHPMSTTMEDRTARSLQYAMSLLQRGCTCVWVRNIISERCEWCDEVENLIKQWKGEADA